MSHIVTLETRLHDPVALAAACQRLGLPAPTQGTAQLFSGEATGLVVQLPGWQDPVVLDPLTGVVRYDAYGGHWGEHSLHRPSSLPRRSLRRLGHVFHAFTHAVREPGAGPPPRSTARRARHAGRAAARRPGPGRQPVGGGGRARGRAGRARRGPAPAAAGRAAARPAPA